MGVEHGNPTPVLIQVDRSDCMRKLVVALKWIAQDVHGQKHSNKYFNDFIPESPQTSRKCWMCDGFFVEERQVDKELDHCHYGGEFLGYAHNKCNLKRRTLNFIAMIAHILSNYDLHHLFEKLHRFGAEWKMEVIPSTDEKYINLSAVVPKPMY